MAIQGLRTTSNFATDERPKNWREGILLLEPNGKAPLFALSSRLSSRTVDDPEFNWWEKELDDRRHPIDTAADVTAVQTVITMGVAKSALTLKDGDILRAEETGEHMLVNGDPAVAGSITVIRGYSGTTAAIITVQSVAGTNPNLLVIGSAYEEGSLAPTGINFDPVKQFNYTQIFRQTLEATRTAMKTNLRTKEAVREAKREALQYFSAGVEMAFWFGQRQETTRNGKPLRTMGGVESYIPAANTKDATTLFPLGVTFADFEEWMYEAFRFGSSEKMAFCGNRAMLAMQRIARNAKGISWDIQTGMKEFGMNVSRIISPFGEIVMKTHPLFNQSIRGDNGGTDFEGFESWMFILDMQNLKYVSLRDSDVDFEPSLEANGLDGMKAGYLGEISMELNHAKTHFLIKNLVAHAAEP